MRHIPVAPVWSDDPELDSLFHPGLAFDHPRDVVRDPDLTLREKRAILSSWASDACAVASHPAMRLPPGAKQPIEFDDIVDALRSLDRGPLPKQRLAASGRCIARAVDRPSRGNNRVVAKKIIDVAQSGESDRVRKRQQALKSLGITPASS